MPSPTNGSTVRPFRLMVLERPADARRRPMPPTRTRRVQFHPFTAGSNQGKVPGGGAMRIRCFLLGCHWTEGFRTQVGGAPMFCQRCLRCGAHRYLSLADEEAETAG